MNLSNLFMLYETVMCMCYMSVSNVYVLYETE